MASIFETLAVLAIITSALAFFVGLQSYRAYRYTGRRYLLNFVAGFLLLGLSYSLFVFILMSLGSPETIALETWARLILDTGGFCLLAYAYYSRTHARQTMALAIVSATSIVSILFVATARLQPTQFDNYFYFVNWLLVLYIALKSLRGYLHTESKQSILVTAGFLGLAFGQFSWMIWAVDNGIFSFVLAQILRTVSYLLILLAFFLLIKGREGKKV